VTYERAKVHFRANRPSQERDPAWTQGASFMRRPGAEALNQAASNPVKPLNFVFLQDTLVERTGAVAHGLPRPGSRIRTVPFPVRCAKLRQKTQGQGVQPKARNRKYYTPM